MRKLLTIAILAAFMSAPALANITENFEGVDPLAAWTASAGVSSGAQGANSYAVLDGSGPGTSRISQGFSVATGGESLGLTFDYRFLGYDFGAGTDLFRVGFRVVSGSGTVVFTAETPDALSNNWQSGEASPNPFDLVGGDYLLIFDLSESSSSETGTFLHLDNINLQATLLSTSGAISVPTPGGLLLGSMGISIVGWLRRRRMM